MKSKLLTTETFVLAKHCGLIKLSHFFYKSVIKLLEEFYYSNYEAESEWPFKSIS